MKEFKRKLLLIDGHALIHRSFHALPAMSNKDGFPTGAIFGFFSMFLKALVDIKRTHALVTFDVKGPTFRDKMAADYKATRKATPNELLIQLPKIKEILQALDIPIYQKEGFEADDLLGIIAHKTPRSEEHTSELQSPDHLVCRLLLEKKKNNVILLHPRVRLQHSSMR